MSSITPDELAALLRSTEPPALLDVRESDENAFCAIAGSRLMPISELGERFAELEDWKDRDVVVTQEEALAHSDSPTNLSWLINNARGQPAATGPNSARPVPAPPVSGGPPSKVPVRTEGTDLGSFKFNMDDA
jgi:hypothetical protein